MTKRLENALERVRRLPPERQDALAALLLEEIEAERRCDAALSDSPEMLEEMADKAQAEHAAGRTRPVGRGRARGDA